MGGAVNGGYMVSSFLYPNHDPHFRHLSTLIRSVLEKKKLGVEWLGGICWWNSATTATNCGGTPQTAGEVTDLQWSTLACSFEHDCWLGMLAKLNFLKLL